MYRDFVLLFNDNGIYNTSVIFDTFNKKVLSTLNRVHKLIVRVLYMGWTL